MPRQSDPSAPASLTSGWARARARVRSTAHAVAEEGGTPGNDAPPLSVTSPAHWGWPLALIGLPPKDGTFQGAGPVPWSSTWPYLVLPWGLGGRRLLEDRVEMRRPWAASFLCSHLPPLTLPSPYVILYYSRHTWSHCPLPQTSKMAFFQFPQLTPSLAL